MRIVHALPANGRIPDDLKHGPRSGIVHSALSFARGAAARCHQVDLLGPAEAPARATEDLSGCRVHTHPGYSFGRAGRWDVRWLAAAQVFSVTHHRPDVLHVHADPNLLRMRGKLRILHLHWFVDDEIPASYHRLLQRADAVVCCSEDVRRRFLAAAPFPERRTIVIRNGTDPDLFRPASPLEKRRLRQRYGLDEAAQVVLFVGAFVPEKGLLQAARAMAHVTSAVPDAVLLAVGGRLWSSLPADAQVNSPYEDAVYAYQSSSVRFLGRVPHAEMPDIYRVADMVIVPSIWPEPFSMSALDGLASGLPVVASRTGGPPEMIDERRNGLLVPPGDEEELGRAIVSLARNPTRRAEMGSNARARARSMTWARYTEEMEVLYQSLLDGVPADRYRVASAQ